MTARFLLGEVEAATIIRASGGDPKTALQALLKFTRERERWLKSQSENPPEGHTREGLYGMGMGTEYVADVVEGVLLRMDKDQG